MSGLHDKQYMEILEEDMGKLRGQICIGIATNPTEEYPEVAGYLGLIFATQQVWEKHKGIPNNIPAKNHTIMWITRDPEWNDTGHIELQKGS